MIDLRKIFSQRLLIVAMAITIFYLLIFRGCGKDPVPPVIAKPTKTIVKEVNKDSLLQANRNDSLTKEVVKWKDKAAVNAKDHKAAAAMVNSLLADATAAIDTSDHEQLRAQLKILVQANAIKDSLCIAAISAQDSVISMQSEQISAQQEFNSRLRESFNQVVANEQAKDKYIGQLKKQVRKKKFGNTVWKIGAGVAGAIILNAALK